MSAAVSSSSAIPSDPAQAAEPSPAKQAQFEAIRGSGWGQPFRLWQPHNLALWVYVLGVGAGTVRFVQYFGSGGTFYAPAITSGGILFAIYLVPWLLLLHHHNRFTSQPPKLLATGFVWGGFAATFWIALPANTALLEIWTKIGGTGFAASWAAGLTAPIDEEFAKAVGLLLLLTLAPRLVRSPYDGFIIGAYIGLGFEVFEDLLYAFNGAAQSFGADQLGSTLKMFLVRGASGIASHALFSAIFCAGLMWILTPVRGQRRPARGVLTMLAAMVFHFAWDDMSGLAFGQSYLIFVLIPGIVIIELLGLFYVLRHAAESEQGWTRAILQPEVDRGTIDAPLQQAVSGLHKQRKTYRKQLRSRRNAHHLIDAGHDLAQAIAEAGGAETPTVQEARDEVVRIWEAGQHPTR